MDEHLRRGGNEDELFELLFADSSKPMLRIVAADPLFFGHIVHDLFAGEEGRQGPSSTSFAPRVGGNFDGKLIALHLCARVFVSAFIGSGFGFVEQTQLLEDGLRSLLGAEVLALEQADVLAKLADLFGVLRDGLLLLGNRLLLFGDLLLLFGDLLLPLGDRLLLFSDRLLLLGNLQLELLLLFFVLLGLQRYQRPQIFDGIGKICGHRLHVPHANTGMLNYKTVS